MHCKRCTYVGTSTKKQRGALFFSGVTIVRGGGGGRGKKKRGIEPTEGEEEAKGRVRSVIEEEAEREERISFSFVLLLYNLFYYNGASLQSNRFDPHCPDLQLYCRLDTAVAPPFFISKAVYRVHFFL